MKKIILIFIYTFIGVSFIHGEDFRWDLIANDEIGSSRLYLDKSSVREVGENHYFWTMVDYLKIEKGDDPNIRSVKSLIIMNCERYEMKIVTFSAYTKNMAKGRLYDDFIIPDLDIDSFAWDYYGPDTLFGGVMEEICI